MIIILTIIRALIEPEGLISSLTERQPDPRWPIARTGLEAKTLSNTSSSDVPWSIVFVVKLSLIFHTQAGNDETIYRCYLSHLSNFLRA